MNSFVKLVVIILICRGTTAQLLTSSLTNNVATNNVTNTIISPSATLSKNIEAFAQAAVHTTISFWLNCLRITENGILDFNAFTNNLNFGHSVDMTSIVNALNIEIAPDGTIDLKSLAQNFNLDHVDWTSLLNSMDINISGGYLDFTNLAQKITISGSLWNYIDSISLESTDDGKLSFMGIAQKYYGNVEEYEVVTEDGCIITVFRLPSKIKGKIVLMSHGVLATADDWILRGKTSLAYILAQKGYDVWVLSYRGSRYSRQHKTLNPESDSRYWYYSMHELGYYDLSAVINFILNLTGLPTLSLIGHSEGTSAPFVLLSSRCEFNNKIDVYISMSPVTRFNDSGFALKALMGAGPVINELLLAFGIQEIMAYDSLSRKVLRLCGVGPVAYNLCMRVVIAGLVGYDPDNMELEFTRTYFDHYPAGTSRQNLEHFYQVGYKGDFVQFDYGSKSKNEEVYGTDCPPLYDLKKVTCKVALMVSRNDKIVGVMGGKIVRDILPNVVDFYEVDDDYFNHLGFTVGKNAHEMLYPHVLEVLDKHSIAYS